MSRSLKIIFTALVLLFIATVILWRDFHGARENGVATNTISPAKVSDNSTSDLSSRPSDRSITTSNTPNFAMAAAEQKRQLAEMGINPGMTKEQMQEQMKAYVSARRELTAKNWRQPIEFYGKTVDQNGKNVSGVQIHLIWTDTSAAGSSEMDEQSDAQGRFNLTGKTGRILQVWLSKAGYIVSKTNQISFDYSSGFTSVPNNPILFFLRKSGAGVDLITSRYGVYRDIGVEVPRDGSPVRVDFFSRKISSNGQLEISQIKPAYGTWKTATAWSYRLTIPDGGLVETRDEFPFEAPESGYQPSIIFDFKKGSPNWAEGLDKIYYIAFGNPRKYGRIHIVTTWMTGTGLEYAINPDGSRNLEPK